MNILKINGQALEGIYVDAAISFNKPAKRVSTYSVPGRNGDLVIDEGTFDNVLITYPVFEKSTFPTKFDEIVNYLASLEGYQRIECSNDPQHYRLGRFVVPQNPTAKRLNRDGYWQLSFDCKPQRWLLSGEEDTEIDANPIDEYSGDIVSIDAVALDEITELKAAIEPVQDLNGQTSPYPAGGGKNLVKPPTTITKNNVTIEGTADGEIWVHGTPDIASGYIQFELDAFPDSIVGSSVAVSVNEKTAGIGFTFGSSNGSINFTMSDTVTSKTGTYTSSNGHGGKFAVNVRYDVGNINKKYKVQLEVGSTATSWQPYSNICPISGHTEVKVTRTGVNVWDEELEQGALNVNTGATFPSTSYSRSKNYIPIVASQTYYCKAGFGIYLLFYDANKNYIGYIGSSKKNATVNPSTSTNALAGGGSLADAKYMKFRYDNSGAAYANDLSINYPSTDTDYHAYAGQTYPISLGQTVYGGTLNVTTGVLTIDRAMVTFDGSSSTGWTRSTAYGTSTRFDYTIPTIKTGSAASLKSNEFGVGIISTPNIEAISVHGNSPLLLLQIATNRLATDNVAGLMSWLADNPLQVVYELATPTTVQLTAEEVELLLGQNNIWADTGDVEVKVTTPTVFNNPSLFNSKPLIRVYGIGTFRVNDITVTIANHDKPYIDIDCELQECYYDTENMNEYVSFSGNDFPELEPGNNYMLLASGITKLDVTPRWWVL